MTRFQSLLSWELISLGIDTRFLNEYLESIHEYAKKNVEKVDKTYQSAVDKNPEDKDYLGDFFMDEWDKYTRRFPELLNNTIFVSCYSMLEKKMKDLDLILKENLKTHFKTRLARPQNLEHYFDNIKRMTVRPEGAADLLYAGLNFDHLKDLYTKIDTNYRVIRNSIIHHGANIIDEKTYKLKSKEFDVISIIPEIKLDRTSGDFRIENDSYVRSFVKDADDFLKDLVAELKKIPKEIIAVMKYDEPGE